MRIDALRARVGFPVVGETLSCGAFGSRRTNYPSGTAGACGRGSARFDGRRWDGAYADTCSLELRAEPDA